ncbi:MAG: hypothetical protein ACJAYE_003036 [Candidatus Azotimanducaceae bacterium]|jgi:hypothetical protein
MSATSGSDLDASWSHIKETLTMLQLSAAQIRSSMQDGDISINELSHSLGTISTSAQQIRELLNENPSDAGIYAENIRTEVQRGIVACQFHDRVTQRLCHVTDSLQHLGDLISSHEDSTDPDNWQKLQEEIRNSYTMDSERIMFEHIMTGASVEEALEIYQYHFNAAPDGNSGDEIELF